MTTIPAVVPPLPREWTWKRNVSPAAAFGWLSAGWRDFTIHPVASISYGLLVFLVSVATIVGLFALHRDYILFPALAGFMVVGPVIGIGLYEKSRRIEEGKPVNLWQMIFVKPESGGQILFAGVLLFLLTLLWMRAAVILYALFFGLRPFPASTISSRCCSRRDRLGDAGGWRRGRRPVCGFRIRHQRLFIPMLLSERTDALTAMGTSMALVWNNLPVMLTWAAIMLALIFVGIVTGLLGMIVVFPVLGHGSWHAYRTMRS
jgi:Predicted integral membrane protein